MAEKISWDLHRSFLAVMREGSLSAAARVLGMTQPSLGRHIRALESGLDAALFVRSPQGLQPTALAHALVPHAEAMASASAALARAASADEGALRGSVRVSASEVIGAEVLPPMLASFRRNHPAVTIELVLSNRNADLLRKDADLAVRMARPTQQALVARRLGQVMLGLYAHRDYLKAHGPPHDMDELIGHALIGFDHEPPYLRGMRPAGLPWERDRFALRTDNDLAALAALRAGVGIGICQAPIARRDKALRPVLERIAIPMELWLVMHEDLRASPRVQRLYAHLAKALADYAAGTDDTGFGDA